MREAIEGMMGNIISPKVLLVIMGVVLIVAVANFFKANRKGKSFEK